MVIAAPAVAQEARPPAEPQPAPEPTQAEPPVIVVSADRLPGQVETDAAPIVKLDEQQVASYGARSIEDLVSQLAPQIGAGRGRGGFPLFLVNGQRITNFREIRRYPPEAIRMVEVLPEEVALKYGAQPDQRVINFVLKNNFSSEELELEYGQPTAGGYGTTEVGASLLTISGPQRTNLSVEWNNTTPLTEAERGVIQTPGSVPTVATDPDPAQYRTLVARNETLRANGTTTRTLGGAGSSTQLTINGEWVHSISRSLSGLETVVLTAPGGATALRTLDADPLARRTKSDTYSFGGGLSTGLGAFDLQLTVDAARGISRTRIDRRRDTSVLVQAAAAGTLAIDGALPDLAAAGIDIADNKTYTVDSLATLKGDLVRLPGGDVSLTLSTGYRLNGIDSSDTRSATPAFSLDRRRWRGNVALGIPVTSRREGSGAAIGDITLSLGGGIEDISDFGALSNWNAGLTWKPLEPLTLQASYVNREEAPSLTQLGAPIIDSFNVPYFDFATGTTVLVTQTSGGNPALLAETQRDWKLSANLDLPFFDRTNLVVEYYTNRSSDVSSSFPQLTAATEAAFSSRVTRDGNGVLTAIDVRPVTYAETRSSRVRYGFNMFGRVGKPNPEAAASGPFGAMVRGGGGAPSPTPQPPADGAAGPPAPARGPGGGGFDPQRFQQIQQQFCTTPEGQMPDLSQLPPQMAQRLNGADGQPDPAKIAMARQRMCSVDVAASAPGTPPAPGGVGPMDLQVFLDMQKGLHCDDPGGTPDLSLVPPEVLEQLKGPNGQIDPARLKEFRERVCAIKPSDLLPGGAAAGSGGGSPGDSNGDGEGGEAQVAAATPRPSGEAPPPAAAASAPSGASRGGAPRGGPGGFGGDGQGRWSLSLFHTINLTNSVLIAPGGPFLDLLDGDATGSGGGVSRNAFELQGGMFLGGIGFRLSGNYRTATTVNGSGLPGSSDLRFGDLATFDLRAFMALDQQKWLVGDEPGFFKGARLSLRVDNIFDSRQRVTDDTGTVPLAYQPALIDPVGRFVEIEFRKLF
ncbi:TonB-dependent receptor [Erythrobacter sp. SDW2]|uniref:TonB-dependent receptor n=1 Tax=Erythrobacter sp. SDW2 TaxID=2907154 RepID=UPI001F4241C5|nr:TonB-dependent receptor [Erythrobacter sp. SDW2]UIP06353.1 TonB-dependent receptor [Erythrobacter sp. SDW2]